MEHLVRYGNLYLCGSHVDVCVQFVLIVDCYLLEIGIKLRCSCQAVYCPRCALLVVDLKGKEWLARVLALHGARYNRVLLVYHWRLIRS
jgi:hypothetical protein